jgi:hypothetical protein
MTEPMAYDDAVTGPGGQPNRHPVRGAFAGLLLGLGIAVLLVTYAKIAFGTLAVPLVILIGLVVGLLVGLFAPSRGPR